jgi:3-isopropylmalate dehydrogenase
MKFNVVVLPGDGIGPEVIRETTRVLEVIATLTGHEFNFQERPIGGCSIDLFGNPLTDAVLAECKSADAVLLGAVGGAKWDDPGAKVRPEQGLLRLRKELGVFANLRPVRVDPYLAQFSPLKKERLAGVDILVVRELTSGLYFGQPRKREKIDGNERAIDTLEYYDYEIEQVMHKAFQLAARRRGKVSSVDKANVLESSRLWRQVANQVSQSYPGVTLEHVLVDTAAMRLIASPSVFDVLVTENMFGDILTDLASVLVGSMGILPSASLCSTDFGLYEPIHGSAPDIAGKGIANPVGAILSAAMMLRYSFHLDEAANALESSVSRAFADDCRTTDVGGHLSTQQMANAIIERLPETIINHALTNHPNKTRVH